MNKPPDDSNAVKSHLEDGANIHNFSHEAMATVFEIIIDYPDRSYAASAARQAFQEVDSLEQDMSRFVENSDISRLNNAIPDQAVQLGMEVYECLVLSKMIYENTGGAFDVSVGSLFQCWFNPDKSLKNPDKDELAAALAKTGMDKLILNDKWYEASVTAQGMIFDLGGIGKGYAVDRMAQILEDWDIKRAMIHGGGSSILAMDPPEGKSGWKVTLSNPLNWDQTLVKLNLKRQAVSGSGQLKAKHIIDPRPGKACPVEGKLMAWSLAPNAVSSDALSTSFIIMSPDEITQFCENNPQASAMFVIPSQENQQQIEIFRYGQWPNAEIIK